MQVNNDTGPAFLFIYCYDERRCILRDVPGGINNRADTNDDSRWL
jgi:hypothetical protein